MNPILIDLALDRVVCRKQIIERYGSQGLYNISTSVEQGICEKFVQPIRKRKPLPCFHLNKLGQAFMADHLNIPLYQIPYTKGTSILHALCVGEVRWRLSGQGYSLLPDYQNLTKCFVHRIPGLQPDVYILKNHKPSIVVEVDRSISVGKTQEKVKDWKERGLEIWWFTSGEKNTRKLHAYDFGIDRVFNLDAMGWNPLL